MKITESLNKKLKRLRFAALDDNGKELLNPEQVEVPVEMTIPEPLQERIKRILQTELSAQAAAQDMETFDEANDFDIDEDPDPVSHYELTEMVEEEPAPQATKGSGAAAPDQPAIAEGPGAEGEPAKPGQTPVASSGGAGSDGPEPSPGS